ncbi:cupin-like domain-containing protein [Sphingorhabdus sp.]|uniref:cupin-like domain-containing protein n=1 Tax=Sphingorhabdus sp. TaxID=1902408 RepID=UPI003BB14830
MVKPVRVWDDVTPEIFATEIRPLGEPALLRGMVRNWPIVSAAIDEPFGAVRYLEKRMANGPLEFALAPPESEGILHYRPDMKAFTYSKRQAPFAEIVAALEASANGANPATIAIQSLDIESHLAGFLIDHPMPLLPQDVAPRIWIGNRAKVATHNDPLDNIACNVAGHRRFTLFPPEQIGNLYMGPLHVTPAGTPISMVHLTNPDLERFPRFTDALESASVAELEPGDALFIPYQWYHHVEALDPLNILINYWWNDALKDGGSPWDAMLHAIMAIRQLPAEQRRAWRANFDHYVFLENGDPGEHLPDFARGILKSSKPEDIDSMRSQLLKALSGQIR